jgi:hypothetical protein
LNENFDRFNFEIYKEKEMADFRRWITVLAVMALFVGLASAQVGTSGSSFSALACSVNNTVTPNLRSEGFTEVTGDIVLICTGGAPLAAGTQIPTVNIQVFYNVPAVTSRLIGNSSTVNASEALLLIDEPDSGNGSSTGYGPSLPQTLCTNPTNGAGPNGCTEFVGTIGANSGVPVSGSAASTTPGANVFQGIVSGASVIFNGIPVLPPVSTGLSRVYRITNVRVNANGAGGGIAGGPGQVNASISVSPSASLPLSNPNPIVGYIQKGLSASVGSAGTFNQCNASSSGSGILSFTENFPTAFKTRVDGLHTGTLNSVGIGNGSNIGVPTNQNNPGYPYNSESDFVFTGLSSGGLTAGLADYGTRLKAVFSNVPAGVTVYVSTSNVSSNGNQQIANPNSNTTATSYAVLLSSETASDGSGVLPTATATNSFTAPSGSTNATTGVGYVGFTSQGSPIVAVWEVINTQPSFSESIYFSVWLGYSGVTQTFPAPGTSQVNLSFAPNPTNGAFSATSAGTTAINTLIPRFADTSGAGSTFATINVCRTVLLFPYVTTLTGFTTGIEIANTTTDPFGTVNQQGTCALNWYQGTNNPAQTVTPNIPSGTIYVTDSSGTSFAGQGFNGYMIAVCNFQLAHGAAVIQDIGAQHILSTYLALILPSGATARNNPSTGENLNN